MVILFVWNMPHYLPIKLISNNKYLHNTVSFNWIQNVDDALQAHIDNFVKWLNNKEVELE